MTISERISGIITASAYKDIDEVMANQQNLVKILTRHSPIAVVKG